MGHIVNPVGYRLGVARGWNNHWYVKSKSIYSRFLREDFMLYFYLSSVLKYPSLALPLKKRYKYRRWYMRPVRKFSIIYSHCAISRTRDSLLVNLYFFDGLFPQHELRSRLYNNFDILSFYVYDRITEIFTKRFTRAVKRKFRFKTINISKFYWSSIRRTLRADRFRLFALKKLLRFSLPHVFSKFKLRHRDKITAIRWLLCFYRKKRNRKRKFLKLSFPLRPIKNRALNNRRLFKLAAVHRKGSALAYLNRAGIKTLRRMRYFQRRGLKRSMLRNSRYIRRKFLKKERIFLRLRYSRFFKKLKRRRRWRRRFVWRRKRIAHKLMRRMRILRRRFNAYNKVQRYFKFRKVTINSLGFFKRYLKNLFKEKKNQPKVLRSSRYKKLRRKAQRRTMRIKRRKALKRKKLKLKKKKIRAKKMKSKTKKAKIKVRKKIKASKKKLRKFQKKKYPKIKFQNNKYKQKFNFKFKNNRGKRRGFNFPNWKNQRYKGNDERTPEEVRRDSKISQLFRARRLIKRFYFLRFKGFFKLFKNVVSDLAYRQKPKLRLRTTVDEVPFRFIDKQFKISKPELKPKKKRVFMSKKDKIKETFAFCYKLFYIRAFHILLTKFLPISFVNSIPKAVNLENKAQYTQFIKLFRCLFVYLSKFAYTIPIKLAVINVLQLLINALMQTRKRLKVTLSLKKKKRRFNRVQRRNKRRFHRIRIRKVKRRVRLFTLKNHLPMFIQHKHPLMHVFALVYLKVYLFGELLKLYPSYVYFMLRLRYLHYIPLAMRIVSDLRQMVPWSKISVAFTAIHQKDLTAGMLATFITKRLKQRFTIQQIFYDIMRDLKRNTHFIGFKLACCGRVTKRQRATMLVKRYGKLGTSSFEFITDYATDIQILRHGVAGIKVWLSFAKTYDAPRYQLVFNFK